VFLLGGAGLLFWLTALMQLIEAGKIELDKTVVVS
jgi:CubicO group peptidase (beta-lactamase class C family)